MSNETYPMTIDGYNKLKEELDQLKRFDRLSIVKEIEVARAHGDLKENAEYHAAKERQGFLEGEMRELEDKISRAQVIDPSTLSGDRVVFGATVTLLNLDTDEEVTYSIVGVEEADVKKGTISYQSPIARGLISKEEGDEVVVQVPGGARTYEIVEVSFGD